MDAITSELAELIGNDANELESWRYPDKKQQFLWTLPESLPVELLCARVAEVTGLDPATTVLSERHLKVYSNVAPEMPPPHKDRSASTITVGIGVDIPAESRLVMWPSVDDEYNPYPTAAEWRSSRHPHELPEVVTGGVEPVEVDLRRGDVVAFRGANIYHERHRPASTAVLYLKFNQLGLDPLGEDPRTPIMERRSAEILARGATAADLVTISPRLVSLRSEHFVPDLAVVEFARLLEPEGDVRLSDEESAFVKTLISEGRRTVGSDGVEVAERLARRGVVVLG
jgi:hypothetical protein